MKDLPVGLMYVQGKLFFPNLQGLRSPCFSLRQSGTLSFVFGFCALRAQKPKTIESEVPCCRRQDPAVTRATA